MELKIFTLFSTLSLTSAPFFAFGERGCSLSKKNIASQKVSTEQVRKSDLSNQ